MRVKFKRLRHDAKIPEYKTDGAAGMDICFAGAEDIVIKKGEIKKVPTGIALEAEDKDIAVFVYARSGLSLEGISMANGVGVIDSDYRGEIICPLINLGNSDYTIKRGQRIGQLVFMKTVHVLPEILGDDEEMGKTARGENGFGSTGI